MSRPAILAGQWKGLALQVAPGDTTRPTRSAVRESIFAWVADWVPEARVLDLYAGSGALGLEALSRGAASACFVERHPAALAALRANLAAARVPAERASLIVTDATRVQFPEATCFDLVLADPPFALRDPLPASLGRPGLLAGDGCLVIEQPATRIAAVRWEHLRLVENRVYGVSRVCLYRPG